MLAIFTTISHGLIAIAEANYYRCYFYSILMKCYYLAPFKMVSVKWVWFWNVSILLKTEMCEKVRILQMKQNIC